MVAIVITNGMAQPPVTILPAFRCLPDFVSGIPVFLDIFLLALVMPVALFQENPPFAMILLLSVTGRSIRKVHILCESFPNVLL